jgi:hypothetical protein
MTTRYIEQQLSLKTKLIEERRIICTQLIDTSINVNDSHQLVIHVINTPEANTHSYH